VTYRNTRVRLSGYVRADSLRALGAGLWMRVDGPTGVLRFDNMIGFGRAIVGTSDWVLYSVVLDVPGNAVGITIGALLNGVGTVRVDDMRFEVVDGTVATTGRNTASAPTLDSTATTNFYARLPSRPENLDFEGVAPFASSTAAWLNSVAKPFSTDAPGSGFDDLAEIGAIVGNARVVAFGEATHGTREFFRMKHRAFEYLVERQGFTHFSIEATMPESRAMDRYVTLGEGNPEVLLSNLYFWTWNTQEVLDLVRWMRAYNMRADAPRLRFVGFDMQSPQQAIDSVRTILGRLDPVLAVRARNTLECVVAGRDTRTGQYSSASYRTGNTLAQRTACGDSLSALTSTIAASAPQWRARMRADDLDWLEQYAVLVRQWERMSRVGDADGPTQRDRSMADNVIWITQKNPSARVFAWAHNGHVSRRPNAMGERLGQQLGAAYRVFGFTFGTGLFNAVGMNSGGGFTPLGVQSVTAIDSSAVEAVFAATSQPRLIFDTRRIETSGATAALPLSGRPTRMRAIGAVYALTSPGAYFEQSWLSTDYDALIWFSTTTASVLLPFR